MVTTLATEIGSLLRLYRGQARLTQRQLAAKAGISHSKVARLERGDQRATLELVERLFDSLGWRLDISVKTPYADIDARIAELRLRPIAERVRDARIHQLTQALTTAGIAYVVTGAAAALTQGVPLPVEIVDLALRADDKEAVAAWLNLAFAQRWHPQWLEYGYLANDPRRPGPMRWQTRHGTLRAEWADELPESIVVDGCEVRPLIDVEISDPEMSRVLARYRAVEFSGR